MSRSKRGLVAAGVLIASASLILAGCSSTSSLGGSKPGSGKKTSIVVGNEGFTENVILADIYGQALAHGGVTVSYKNAGNRAPAIAALKAGEINLIPEYSGSILNFLDKSAKATAASDVDAALKKALPSNIVSTTPASAADSDTVTVTQAYATANNLTSIADLKNVKSWTMGAPGQFQQRPDGVKGLISVYGLSNIKFKAIEQSPQILSQLQSGAIQAADIFSTDPSITNNKLVSLTDPKNLFASQEVVPVLSKKVATAKVTKILNSVSAKLTTADLLKLVGEAQGTSGKDPAVVAKEWLTSKGLN